MANYRTYQTDLGLKISGGNIGIGKIPCISKDHSTCGYLSKYCRDFCYMNTPFYNSTPSIANAHKHNGDTFRKWEAHPSMVSRDITQSVKKHNWKYFRINVNGDFSSYNEVLAWVYAARQCPETTFLAYTKKIEIFADPSLRRVISLVDNFKVRMSIFFNYPDELIIQCAKLGLPLVFSDTVNRFNAVKCQKPCETCLVCYNTDKDVYIPMHGKTALKRKREYEKSLDN